MKTILGLLVFILALSSAGAQVKFEKGYFIDNDGHKVECLIENKDWINNPENFKYKLSSNDLPQRATVSGIKEFAIDGYSKFISAIVKIDTSNLDVANVVSQQRNPEWATRALFLKVIVDGETALYYYELSGKFRFFYKTLADSSIRQLVYKEYMATATGIASNIQFKQQLLMEVRCGNVTDAYFNAIRYNKEELRKHFVNYNKCMGYEIETSKVSGQTTLASRDFLNIKVTGGFNSSSVSAGSYPGTSYNVTFDKKMIVRVGVEFEYVLPFNKNKWSVFIEPTYMNNKTHKVYDKTKEATLHYKLIEFPIGIRHYFFLNDNSRIFLNAIIVPGKIKDLSKSQITYTSTTNPNSFYSIYIKPRNTFSVGGGFLKGPISLEARYYFSQELLGDYIYFSSTYKRVALIATYRFLRFKTKVAD